MQISWLTAAVMVIAIALYQGGVHGLRMTKLDVPSHATVGQAVKLRCSFDLAGAELYMVKWYKGSREFFRYVPFEQPPSRVFWLAGIEVELSESGQHELTLKNVSLQTSGLYRCEVSCAAPTFASDMLEAHMRVVAMPEEAPVITGALPKYGVGDIVSVTCTSYGSNPAATLAWIVNGEKASKEFLHQHRVVIENGSVMETSKLGLEFPVRDDHFLYREIRLRCTATIAPVYFRSSEVSLKPLQQLPFLSSDASGGDDGVPWLLVVPFLNFLLHVLG